MIDSIASDIESTKGCIMLFIKSSACKNSFRISDRQHSANFGGTLTNVFCVSCFIYSTVFATFTFNDWVALATSKKNIILNSNNVSIMICRDHGY